jgi:transcription antitermination protein NusB
MSLTESDDSHLDAAEAEVVDAQESPAPRRERLPQSRRQARTLALETLYETDLAGHRPGEVLVRRTTDLQPSAQVEEYARELLNGVLQHRRELDAIIQERAPAWPVEQMAAIDRNILRLGLFECLHNRDTVPLRVAINEAIELAKLYGGDSSARFVNGVIGRVVGSTPDDAEELTEPQEPESDKER